MLRPPHPAALLLVLAFAGAACGDEAGDASGRGSGPGTDGAGRERETTVTPATGPAAESLDSGGMGGLRILTGLYVHLAGVPSFSPCGTEEVVPVWQDSAGEALERSYLARPEPAAGAVRVRVRGRIDMRQGATRGGREVVAGPHLRVDSLLAMDGEVGCPGSVVATPLQGTDWELVGTGGGWLRLTEEPDRVRGHTGCRAFSGRFVWTGTLLRFQGLTSSPGDCPGDPVHRSVLEGLAASGSYRIRGDTLWLLGESGALLTLTARR